MDAPRSRRAVLGSAAGATAMASGCLADLNAFARGQRRPVSVSILTAAPDTDPFAPVIARRLATALETAGVRATLLPTSESNLWREVLVNGKFDIYVGRHPIDPDPDVLRELFHSRFAEEPGWQNPTGVTDPALDELLDRQRHETGRRRVETTAAALDRISELGPIAPLCVPYDLRMQRVDDRLEWSDYGVRNALSYVSLGTPDRRQVTVGIAGEQGDWNLNPLGVVERDLRTIVDLLYDRLAVRTGGDLHPWLAAGWETEPDGGADGDAESVLTISLRDGATWHDGSPIRARDVAFTYRLLEDTALGSSRPPAPTVRYRGRSSLVRSVEAVDDVTVRLAVAASPTVAPVALTVPILPRHIWRSRGTRGRFTVLDDPVTEAITTLNETPVGSGPYRHLEDDRTRLLLSRTPEHFLEDDPGGFAGEVGAPDRPERLEFAALASRDMAREFLRNGELDAATVPMSPAEFERMRADALVETVDTRALGLYGIGFNLRRYPMTDAGFRRVISRLVDREHVSRTVFGRRARPTTSVGATLVDGTGRLRWRGDTTRHPFLGSDGDVDAARAREAFRDVGFAYSEQGHLLVRR